METKEKRPCLRMTLLLERYYEEETDRVAVGRSGPGSPVVCRLWRMVAAAQAGQDVARPAMYALGMESPTRRYLYCLGEEEASARRLLETVVAGRLAPLHLRDVVEDYRWEEAGGAREDQVEEFAGSPLQMPPSMV